MNLYQNPQLNRFSLVLFRFLMAVGGVFTLSMILAYLLAGEIYEYQDTIARGALPSVDAIVCLAGGRGRIGLAGDVWLQYWEAAQSHSAKKEGATVPVLYLSGVGPQIHWSQMVKQFKPQVQKFILPENVMLENESSNTVANAVWLAHYAKSRNWKSVLLLTSTYHMKRAQLIFQRVLNSSGNQIKLETLSVFQDPFSSSHWRRESIGIRVTLLEYVKSLYYRTFWLGY
jgi:hypothetical protein